MRRKAAEKLALAPRQPDLVDRIFELIADRCDDLDDAQLLEAKLAVRVELGGSLGGYIRSGHEVRRADLARQILASFNGRNAREVARELNLSRATVYRFLKQPGIAEKLSQIPKRLETADPVVSAQPTAPLASSADETD